MASSTTERDPVLETALAYIAEGINCTPVYGPKARVTDAGKRPRLDAWQNLRLTSDEYRKAHRKGDNVGVVTGRTSGLICVDCDKKDDPARCGVLWFIENEARLGQFVREDTPRGGIHLWYRYPAGRDFVPSKGKLFPGVDFMADGGRQVVTWPSGHKNGSYVFRQGLSLIDVADEAGEIPEWILEEADRAHRVSLATAPKAAPGPVDESLIDIPQEIDRARERMKTYPAAIEGEGGDFRTVQAAWECKKYNLSPETTLQLLAEIYNPRCEPPWALKDLAVKVRNAYKYGKEPSGKETAANDFPPDDPAALAASVDDVRPPGAYQPRLPIASARHFIERNRGRVLCQQGQMYVYRDRNAHWDMVDDELFEATILRDINAEDADACKKLKMGQLRDIARAVKRELQAAAADEIVPDTWLDGRAGQFVPLRNGILDVGTGELLPHDPTWFSFTTLPFDYAPAAQCPAFLDFLASVWDGDDDLVRAMRLWMGYVLTSSMSAQKFAVLIGESRAGKSTLARVIEGLVGKRNTVACSLMLFGGDFGLEPVLGKRLAIFNDAQRLHGTAGDIATERIISIVGNDPQPVNRKNRGILTVHLPAKIMLVCNEIPHFVNRRDALTNRMLVFPFRKSFKGKEDLTLHDRLMAELPGILNWALDGARAIMGGEKLHQAAAGEAAVQEIAEILDSIQGFLSDAVEFTNDTAARDSFVTSTDLYDAYKRWCRDANMGTHGMKRFFQEFKSKARDRVTAARSPDRKRVKGYYGLRLVTGSVADFPPSYHENDDMEL
jgi:putative DNA primase/helicase